MISYQWDHQKIFIDVRNALLKAGHKVWMDIDQMGGSTLEAMASAVEGAKIVLMSVSKKYKDSVNCRSGTTVISLACFVCCSLFIMIYMFFCFKNTL